MMAWCRAAWMSVGVLALTSLATATPEQQALIDVLGTDDGGSALSPAVRWIAAGVLAIVAVVIAGYLMSWVRRDRQRGGELVRSIFRAAGCHGSDRAVLHRIAQAGRIDESASLTLSEGLFDYALRQAALRGLTPARPRQVMALRRKLFGTTTRS